MIKQKDYEGAATEWTRGKEGTVYEDINKRQICGAGHA